MTLLSDFSLLELEQLAHLLRSRGQMLGTAESCTGGLAAAWLTSIPGSSKWFRGGVITYANELKTRFLSVPEETLHAHGAVSEETVRAMAQGALHALQVDHSLSITGIAGPDGGTEEKPVGTVWAGASINGQVSAKRFQLSGNRNEIRSQAAKQALLWVMALLQGGH